MNFAIEDVKTFKQCVDAIVNLIDEGVFEVSKDGMSLRSMDPSQIAMVDFVLPKKAFAKLDAPEKTSLGLNLADLSKILSRTRADEKLSIELDEKESRLLLKFAGQSKRSFKLPLLDSSSVFPKEPKIAFEATVKLNGGAFKDMLRDAGMLSSHVTLSASSKDFLVEAHGDAGDLKIETLKDAESIAELKASSKATAMFPFEYLDDMTRACPDDAVIAVELKSDAPVRVSYAIGEAKLAYYLAPRVESG